MAGNYEIFAAMSIGGKEIVLEENPEAEVGAKYMCAYCEGNELFDWYTDVMSGDDYLDLLQLYCERLREATTQLREEIKWEQSIASTTVPASAYTPLTDNENLKGKVIVVAPEVFKREFQRATRQYQYVTGGFGASPNSRGSACFCVNLFDGEKSRFERHQILGVVEPSQLPSWAKAGLDNAKEGIRKDKEAR